MTASRNPKRFQDNPVASVERQVEAFMAVVKSRRKTGSEASVHFGDVERQLVHGALAIARAAIGEELARHDTEADAVTVDGRVHRRVLRSSQTYTTAAGPVVIERNLFKDRSNPDGRCISAVDARVGIIDGHWTPGAAEHALWLVTQIAPAKAEEALRRVGTFEASKSSLDRLPKTLSAVWEGNRPQFDEALREATVVPEGTRTMAVSIDGVFAPMRDSERQETRDAAAADGRLTRGPAGYREVGCATLAFCDGQGEMLGSIRMARAPEPGKTTLKQQLHEELIVAHAKNPRLRVAKLADGAEDNWNYFSSLALDGPEIIDFFHACEHLHAALAAAYGDGSRKTRSRFEELKTTLRDDEDGVERVIATLSYLARRHGDRSAISTAHSYFRKHERRMRYWAFKQEGFPIGTGVVEAACKTLVTQRLKQSGMRWSNEGAQAILTPRGWDQSERFDAAWALLSATFQLEVSIVSKVSTGSKAFTAMSA